MVHIKEKSLRVRERGLEILATHRPPKCVCCGTGLLLLLEESLLSRVFIVQKKGIENNLVNSYVLSILGIVFLSFTLFLIEWIPRCDF